MIANRSTLSAYRRMSSPLSASTPKSGLTELDPLKRPSLPGQDGYNAQSAANAQTARGPSPASSFPGQDGYVPPPTPAVPPPTQPLAPLPAANGAVSRKAPALALGGPGSVVTPEQFYGGPRPTGNTAPEGDPNARIWPLNGGRYGTRAEWEAYQRVLGNPTAGMGNPAADRNQPPPGTGGIIDAVNRTGTGSQAAGGNLTPPQADNVQANASKTLYDDPLIKALLAEVQGKLAGDTTAAQNRMNDRAQQQANASRQDVDRRLAGRSQGASSPLRDKMYNDIQMSVDNQIALRDAQMQEQAAEQGRQLYDSVQSAKNAEAYRNSVALQQQQYQQGLYRQEKQAGIDNVLSLLSLIPQAPAFATGFDSLKKLFGGGAGTASSPGSQEIGFRLPQSGNLASYIRGGR